MCTGEPMMTTRANVTVTVVDRAMPVFDKPLYSVTVPESLPQYATLLTVSAQSPTSSSLIYSIIDGNDLGQFGVDFSVGKTFFFIRDSYWYSLCLFLPLYSLLIQFIVVLDIETFLLTSTQFSELIFFQI